MPYLYILSGLVTETQNSEYFNVLVFKDMEMISFYHMLGYRVYLILEVTELFLSELNLMWLELNLTQDEVQNLINLCLCKNVSIHKHGIDFFSIFLYFFLLLYSEI